MLRSLKRFRPSPALIVAVIALFVAIGGVGYAASKIGTNDIKNGAVTAKKLHKNAATTKKIKNAAVKGAKLSDDQRTLWAAVQSDGTIADQSGGIQVTALGSGSYVVDFNQNVSGRALVASGVKFRNIANVNLCNGGGGVGSDCSPSAPNDNQHVAVNTTLAVGTITDTNLPFYVAALPK